MITMVNLSGFLAAGGFETQLFDFPPPPCEYCGTCKGKHRCDNCGAPRRFRTQATPQPQKRAHGAYKHGKGHQETRVVYHPEKQSPHERMPQ